MNTSWRRTLYAMWIAQTLTIIGFSMRAPFLPFYIADLGVTTFEQQAIWAGAVNAAGALVMAITAPLWGIAADRWGRKPMVLRSMFAGALTISIMALATSPWHLLGLRFVEGGFTGTVTAATALVATTVPKERMGFSLGLMQTAIFSGSAIGPLIGGFLADSIGYQPTFIVAGSMLFISGWIVLFLVAEQFKRPESTGEEAERQGTMSALLFGKAMLALVLIMLVLRMATMAIQPIVPLFVQQLSGAVGSVSTLSGLALGVMGLTSAISAVVLGRMGDRIGGRKILIVSGIVAGLLYLPLAGVQSVAQLILVHAVLGIAAGGVMPAANALVAHLTPAGRRGAVYGFIAAATSVGAFVGPLGGAMLAASVSIRASFLVAGILMVLAGLWIWRAIPVDVEADDAPLPEPTRPISEPSRPAR